MRFDASEGSEQFYEQISNFFHAFGFFILGNALQREDQERLLKVGDKISLDRKKVPLEQLPADANSIFGHTIEDYAELKELLVPNSVDRILKKALGNKYLYLGSDLSVFNSKIVQPWHRDWITDLPIMKVGYYSLPKAKIGGQLRIIPGTHDIRSNLNKVISGSMAWPARATHVGGLNESNAFPKNIIYSEPLNSQNFNYLYNHYGSKISADEKGLAYLPHQELDTADDTAFVCFDPRTIHSGTWSEPAEQRILFSALFAANPFSDFPKRRNLKITDTSELALQLLELLIIDRLFHDVLTTYHPDGKLPNFASEHLVDFGFKNGKFFISNENDVCYYNHLPKSGVDTIQKMTPESKAIALRQLNSSYYA